MPELNVADDPIDLAEAHAVIAGYAFGEEDVTFEPPKGPSYGTAPEPKRRIFAYQTYDCVPPDRGPLSDLDLLIVAGMNVRFDSQTAASLRAIADEVSDVLARIDNEVTFWSLEQDYLRSDAEPPESSSEWNLDTAWWLISGMPDLGFVIAHKVLHHKRPRLVPLVDRETVQLLGEDPWAKIHHDLTTQETAWEKLEAWFAERAAEKKGVPLSRLRLHDILLWCRARAIRYRRALEYGRPYV